MMFGQITPMSQKLHERGFHVTVETAGTIDQAVFCDLMSISPKLSNSTPGKDDPRDPSGAWNQKHEARRLNFDVLSQLVKAHPCHQLKFVVSSMQDLAEIKAILQQLPSVEPADVMLMPQGVQLPDEAHKRWVVGACLEHGWRYCHRLHIELFGNTPGT